MGHRDGIAIVVPSWNGLEDLKACVSSIRAQRSVHTELFVVDNGSIDGTVEYLEREGIAHFALPRNLGFSTAVNIGIDSTASPMVMVLNSDTLLEPDCLFRISKTLQSDPEIGGVQPLILQATRGAELDRSNPDVPVYSIGQSMTKDGRGREDGEKTPQGELVIDSREIFGVCGAACVFRRELLGDLGGYDERYFAFYEDVDLNVRARMAGWRFWLDPEAVVWHYGNQAWHAGFRRPDAQNARLVARNRLATQIKFMPLHSIPRIAMVEVGALGRALTGRRFLMTLAGKLEMLRWIPSLLRERRGFARTGDPRLARAWLGSAGRRRVAQTDAREGASTAGDRQTATL